MECNRKMEINITRNAAVNEWFPRISYGFAFSVELIAAHIFLSFYIFLFFHSGNWTGSGPWFSELVKNLGNSNWSEEIIWNKFIRVNDDLLASALVQFETSETDFVFLKNKQFHMIDLPSRRMLHQTCLLASSSVALFVAQRLMNNHNALHCLSAFN